MQRKFTGWAALAVLVVTAASSAFAEKEPKAVEVYDRLAAFLATQPAISVDFTTEYTLVVGDAVEQSATDYQINFHRPDSLAMRLRNPRVEVETYVGGGLQTTYIPAFGQYTTEAQSEPVQNRILYSGFGPMKEMMVIPAQIAIPNPFESVLRHTEDITYIAQEELNGKVYDRIRTMLGPIGYDMWVETGDAPVIGRVVPILDEYVKTAINSQEHVEFDSVIEFSNWNFDEAHAKDNLLFAGANDAEFVKEFRPPSSTDVLVGKPAIPFSLAMLDGSTLNLSDKIGEEIIILDFWATWCGPCRVAMPVLERVTAEFAPQGARLYAVNLNEEPEQISAFVKEMKLEVDIALDRDGKVAAAYMVDAIPQTVIIGKDGLIQAIHIGVDPNLEHVLRGELGALAGGGSLISE